MPADFKWCGRGLSLSSEAQYYKGKGEPNWTNQWLPGTGTSTTEPSSVPYELPRSMTRRQAHLQ